MSATITWWGCGCVQLDLGDRTLVVDPYVHPRDADVDYVCITHDHSDHLHPTTLEPLTSRPAFQRLMVPRSGPALSTIDSPISEDDAADGLSFVADEKVTVMYPKYTREPGRTYAGTTELDLDGIHVETIDSSERPWREKGPDGGVWPSGTGRYLGHAEYPNLGYVITHHQTGLTFYATGDLGEVFDAQRELRGRVDYMFIPISKLEGIELSLVRSVQPRYVIPIHYRVDTPEFPIPISVTADQVPTTNIGKGGPRPGVDPEVYRADLQRKIRGHWFPTPLPPLDRIRRLEPQIRRLGTGLLLMEAGRPYEVAPAAQAQS